MSFLIDLQVVKLWIAHVDLADQMSNVDFVALITADTESVSYRSMKEITGHAATFCADARFLAENVKNLALSADPRRCGNVDDFCSLYDNEGNGTLDIVNDFVKLVNEEKETFNDTSYLVEFGTFDKWLNSNGPSEVHDKIAKLRQMTNTSYVADKVTCAAEFGKFLADTLEWLDTASMINESLPLQPADQTDALDQLIDNIEWLRESTYNYTVGQKTQVYTNPICHSMAIQCR